jgi:homoserine kinase
VAPCLYGGFVLIRSYNPVDLIKIDAPKKLFCTVLHPQFEIKTSVARKMLKKNVPLKSTVTQCGNTAGLITGLLRSDYKLIGRSLVDVIVEPVRAQLIPGYQEIRNAAFENNALNCNISGSGPAMFAFSTSEADAVQIGKAMKKASSLFTKDNKVHVSKVNTKGPLVIS